MASKKPSIVYRVTHLPAHVDRLAAAELLADCIPGLELRDIRVCSLATAIDSWSNKTATVMFCLVPDVLNEESRRSRWEFQVSGLPVPIVLDSHFYGLTPLNDVHETIHTSDCVVISGLGSHPMGSWQPKGDKAFMWIRDSLPSLLPGVRFIIYGYDTKLPNSKSFQSIPDLAISFIASLQAGDWVSKPLLFLSHSLGGVIVKQSIVALAGTKEDQILSAMRGGIFFGVPSVGMSVQDLYEMLGEQPNKVLLDCLSDTSDYVPKLEEDFERASFQRMRLVWAYETQQTPSLFNSGGSWGRSGPGIVMVPPSSATGGRHKFNLTDPTPISSNDEWIVQIDADHSNMVKFAIDDQLIATLADKIQRILRSDMQDEGEGHRDENLVRSTAAPKSISSFRQRCKDLISALGQITPVPADTVRTFDIVDETSKFLVKSGKILELEPHINRQPWSVRAQIPEWIESLEDLRWFFKEICVSSTAQSTRVVRVLESCTNLCSDVLDVLESTRLSTTGFFNNPLNRYSLKQIISPDKSREQKIRTSFEQLKRSKSILIIAIELLIVNLTPSAFSKLKDHLDLTSEESDCIGALRITDPSHDREGIASDKGEIVKGTCKWILSTNQFETWIEASELPQTLWISAPPGMGKTYVSIFLSRRLQRLCEIQGNSITIFFFCDNKVETRNTGSSILCGLTYQLIQWRKNLIKVPLQQWKIQNDVFSHKDSFQSMWGIFEDMIESLPDTTVYCLVDALDECDKQSALPLLKKFNQLTVARPKVKLIAVSRRHPDHIAGSLSEAIQLEIDQDSAAKGDIKLYISDSVHHLAKEKRFTNERLHQHIEDVFLQKAQDTFLWVSFMTNDLLQKTVIQIETSLDQLPIGLDAVYGKILSQVDLEKADIVSKMLGWIALAVRPLSVSEICEALRIQPTSHLTRQRVCLDYISACGHLLQITEVKARKIWSEKTYQMAESDCSFSSIGDHRGPDDQDMTGIDAPWRHQQQVTFVHQSAKDYLLKTEGRTAARFRVDNPQRMHEEIATRLMHEMAGGCLEDPVVYLRWELSRALNWPLAIYAITNWHVHFNQVADYERFARMHAPFFEAGSSLRFKWEWCKMEFWMPRIDRPMPLLLMACELHLVAPARRILQLKREQLGSNDFKRYINTKWSFEDETALDRACSVRDVDMIKLLLDYGADPTIKDRYHQTPLHHYCMRLDEPSVFVQMVESKGGKELVEAEGAKLLYEAALNGHPNICRLLIERYGVHVDAEDSHRGDTALVAALRGGYLELAHMFVNEWHASTDNHWRLLKWISQETRYTLHKYNWEEIIQLIKCWDLNINVTHPLTGEGLVHQPFWRDISKEETVLLLGLGLDPSTRDQHAETVLHKMVGISMGVIDMEALRLLLQDGRLKINAANFRGNTMLHAIIHSIANYSLYEVVCQEIKYILDLGVDRNLENINGKTSLDLAYELIERTWKDCLNSDTTSSTWSADSEDKMGWGVPYGLTHDVIELLHNYATVPLFSDWPEKAETKKTDNRGGTATKIWRLSPGIRRPRKKVTNFIVTSIHDRRRPWLGGSRRWKAIKLQGWKSLLIVDK